jgi:hypothetical protein
VIRRGLAFVARLASAAAGIVAAMLYSIVVLMFVTLIIASVIVRVAFNAPLIAWRAASNKAPPPQ